MTVLTKKSVVLLTAEDEEALHYSIIHNRVFGEICNRFVDGGGVGVTREFSGVVGAAESSSTRIVDPKARSIDIDD